MNFKCVTWNVGMRKLPENSPIPYAILQELQTCDADIICLQEIELRRKKGKHGINTGIIYFESLLDKYNYVIHDVDDVKLYEGNLTLFKKGLFKLINSKKQFSFVEQPNQPVYLKALCVYLQYIPTNKCVCFMNVHLKAGYNTFEDRRVQEVQCLLEYLRESTVVCMCGDFNDNLKPGRKLEQLLRDSFTIEQSPPSCYTRTGYSSFDKILSRGFTFKYIDNVRNNDYVKKCTIVPDAVVPSDHLPIGGDASLPLAP